MNPELINGLSVKNSFIVIALNFGCKNIPKINEEFYSGCKRFYYKCIVVAKIRIATNFLGKLLVDGLNLWL